MTLFAVGAPEGAPFSERLRAARRGHRRRGRIVSQLIARAAYVVWFETAHPGLRVRRLGCSGSSAINSAQENSDHCPSGA